MLRCNALGSCSAAAYFALVCIVVKSSHCIVVASSDSDDNDDDGGINHHLSSKSPVGSTGSTGQFSRPSTWHSPRLAVIYHDECSLRWLVLSHCNFDFYCSSFAMNSPSICKQSKQFIKASITWIYSSVAFRCMQFLLCAQIVQIVSKWQHQINIK